MPTAPGAVPAASGPQPSTILIVDDSEGDALLAELALNEIVPAASVRHVDSGGAALDLLAQQLFDLVLLDLAMPGLTGFDVLDTLGRRGGFDGEILVLTSSSRPTDRERVAGHGIGYVVKDTDFAAFSVALATALGQP